MSDPRTEEKLRKLAAIDRTGADHGWLAYLGSEGAERQLTDELFDVLLHQKVGKDFRERILLEPAPADVCRGAYRLGEVSVSRQTKSSAHSALREDEWIKHVLITGMTGGWQDQSCIRDPR